MTVKVTIPDSAITLESQDFSEQLYALKENADFRGAEKIARGEVVEYYISPEKMPIDAMILAVSNGGEVENFPLFIEVDSLDSYPPEGFIMSEYQDEEGVTHRKTWNEWLSNYCYPLLLDGKIYVESSACGICPKGSDLIPVFDKLTHNNRIKDIQSNQPNEL